MLSSQSRNIFHFKQFSINQDKAAMKIGTDGVLLAAWCPIKNNPNKILDIGTGTGVIALMLAQQTNAQKIDAIEIEQSAFEQASDNFKNSIWADRLSCHHTSLKDFIQNPKYHYDLIVSNPPFYSENYKSSNKKKDIARFQTAMPFIELIEKVIELMDDKGTFCVIIPYKEVDKFIALSNHSKLFLCKITCVKGNAKSKTKRCLLKFSKQKMNLVIDDELIIETQRNEYTQEYKNLVKQFYLKM